VSGEFTIVLQHSAADGDGVRAREIAKLRSADVVNVPGPLCVRTLGNWIACAVGLARGVTVQLFDESDLELRAEVTLAGARSAQLRLSDEAWTIGDDRGRVVALELAYGGVVRDLRV